MGRILWHVIYSWLRNVYPIKVKIQKQIKQKNNETEKNKNNYDTNITEHLKEENEYLALWSENSVIFNLIIVFLVEQYILFIINTENKKKKYICMLD